MRNMTAIAGSQPRLEQAHAWLSSNLDGPVSALEPVAGDASFRGYYRLTADEQTWILMDAPPAQEDSAPFMDVCRRLRAGGVYAPEIFAADLNLGFLLLEDLGDELLRGILTTNNADDWLPRFLDLLGCMAHQVEADGLPGYDRNRLLTELELFPAWYLEKHQGLKLSCEDWDVWEALCTRLILSAHEQPRVFVHRDFHSCNLLLTPGGDIGVIDFQDAVHGPLTYDFISLIWDRYIAWPRTRLEAWMEAFRLRVAPGTDPVAWIRWCDWMGLQRNLKVVGIFARLYYRDGKQGYLEMIPQFWGYLMDVLPRYPETTEFRDLLERLQCAP